MHSHFAKRSRPRLGHVLASLERLCGLRPSNPTRGRKRKEPETCSGLFFFAPRVGFEPTTNSLHLIHYYEWDGLYHYRFSIRGASRTHELHELSTPFRDSLYTFPDFRRGLARDCPRARRVGVSPNSPRFSIRIPSESCLLTASRSTTELPRNVFVPLLGALLHSNRKLLLRKRGGVKEKGRSTNGPPSLSPRPYF